MMYNLIPYNKQKINKQYKKIIIFLSLICLLLVGCGKQKESSEETIKEVALTDILEAVQKAYGEEYAATMEYDQQMIEEVIGLSSDLYEDIIAMGPMMSANVDTFIVVKAKQENIAEVETALNEYRETLIADTMQYPMNVMKIQASEVKTYGSYVCFIMLGYIDMEIEEKGEDAALEAYQKENQKAVSAIEQLVLQKE